MWTLTEFFAGGGMARAGFGPGWRVVFANDISEAKERAYVANFGSDHFLRRDVEDVTIVNLPLGRVDCVWMSPPCVGHSEAGKQQGFEEKESRAFWPAWEKIEALDAQGRAPLTGAFEKVTGIKPENLRAVQEAFARAHHRDATRIIDARHCVPQSRERVFVIGAHCDLGVDPEPLLERAMQALPVCNTRVIDILDPSAPCRTAEETAEVLALMAPRHLAKVEEMRRAGRWVVRTYFRRRRPDGNGGKVQRAEIRDDEIAGALRTAAGGSSLQSIIAVNGPVIRTRLLTPKECGRLMGLPDSYRLPENDREAYDLLGDGVCVPIVRHLAEHVLEPILIGGGKQR